MAWYKPRDIIKKVKKTVKRGGKSVKKHLKTGTRSVAKTVAPAMPVVGAVLGTLMLPGLGSTAGAALGTLAGASLTYVGPETGGMVRQRKTTLIVGGITTALAGIGWATGLLAPAAAAAPPAAASTTGAALSAGATSTLSQVVSGQQVLTQSMMDSKQSISSPTFNPTAQTPTNYMTNPNVPLTDWQMQGGGAGSGETQTPGLGSQLADAALQGLIGGIGAAASGGENRKANETMDDWIRRVGVETVNRALSRAAQNGSGVDGATGGATGGILGLSKEELLIAAAVVGGVVLLARAA